MLRQGLITPSKSDWSAPIVLVTKPDKSIRICINYRRLNDISTSDNYPIPRISELIENIGSAKYLTQLDLTKGYYHIPLSEDTTDSFCDTLLSLPVCEAYGSCNEWLSTCSSIF